MPNPIIQRELVGTLRTGKAVAIQIGLIVILTILVLLRWPSDAQVQWTHTEARDVLRIFGYGLMAIVMLMAPAFASTSIVKEHQQGTLALLIHSPMTRWSILLGKLAAVLGFVVLLLVLSLPAAAACYAMGGINFTDDLFPLYAVLFLTALEYCALGLMVSSHASSMDSALRITYGLVLLLSIVSVGPHFVEVGLMGSSGANVLNWLRSLSPIPAMMDAMAQSGIGASGIRSEVNLVGRFTTTSLVLSALMLWRTSGRLDTHILDRPRPAGTVTDERSKGVQIFRRLMYLWFFDPKRRSGLTGPLTNPVLVKEFRTRRFGRSHWILRMIGGCMVISLLLTLATAESVSDRSGNTGMIGSILVVLQMTLLILLTPSLASGLISAEREAGGWQLLQMTPLPARSIIFGKLVSVMWTLLLVLVATLPGYLVMIAIQETLWREITYVLITMVITAIFALLLSATVSSMLRRTAQSTTVAYALLLGLIAGTILIWLGRDSVFTKQTVETVLMVNPLATALALIKSPGFAEYRNLVPANWWILGGACIASLLLLLLRTWRLMKPQ